jgi:DNA polymerase-3 subunit delta
MTFEQILKDIHQKKYAPIYFLMGEEPYFIDVISDTIEEEVLDETEKAFNQIVVYGRDVDIDIVANHAKSFSMMGGYMVVIVKEAQDMKDIEDFEKYLDVIPNTTILVFDYKYKKLDKRRALAKKIEKMGGVLFESKKLYESNIPGWIQTYLSGKGYAITPKATQMLTDFLGTDLHKVRNELDKLIIALPKQRKIDDADVERNIGISKDFNVFELQNALGRRDAVKAMQIVQHFAESKDNPLFLTAISLYGYFTKILKVHYSSDQSQNGLAAAIGVSPYFVRDYQMASRNYTIGDCVRCIAVLREFDLKSKGYNTGETPVKDLYREMIFKLLH